MGEFWSKGFFLGQSECCDGSMIILKVTNCDGNTGMARTTRIAWMATGVGCKETPGWIKTLWTEDTQDTLMQTRLGNRSADLQFCFQVCKNMLSHEAAPIN